MSFGMDVVALCIRAVHMMELHVVLIDHVLSQSKSIDLIGGCEILDDAYNLFICLL